MPGVGQVLNFGASEYAMRIWVKPDQLAKLGLTVADLLQRRPAAEHGEPRRARSAPSRRRRGRSSPTPSARRGGSSTPEEFGNVVVRLNPDGSAVRLKDVARIELGALSYKQIGRFNGQPSSIIGIYQAPGSNALAVAAGIKKAMAELKTRFPEDLDYAVSVDTTAAGDGGHPGDREHARRGDAAGDPRRLPLPPELAGDADPAARRAGVARSARSRSSRCSASRSTRCRSSAWCWRSASWWTTRSSWWRRWSTTSSRGCRRARPRSRR